MDQPVTRSDLKSEFGTSRFINRELSWLAFNERVLEEAANIAHPVLERLRFLSISSSNLDEFYSVRVAGIKAQDQANIDHVSDDGLSPAQQLDLIHEHTRELLEQQYSCWLEIVAALQREDINFVDGDELSKIDRAWLEDYFFNSVFPVLTPLAIDPAHPFPFVPNEGLALVAQLYHGERDEEGYGLLLLPQNLGRFVKLPGEATRFIAIERLTRLFLGELFPGRQIHGTGVFRVLRDSDLALQEEAEDLVRTFENALRRRRRGSVILLKFSSDMPADIQKFIMHELEVTKDDVVNMRGFVGMAALAQIIGRSRPDLLFKPFSPRFPERIRDFGGDCFAAIRSKDIVVHHPYESFDVVVQFLHQAAHDPQVLAIKQTLYRTSEDSPIMEALIEAAEKGKSVTAMVELKARFDEALNIKWARRLESAGVQVVYGFLELKTHAKASLVIRQEGPSIRTYCHFGTGNYHPNTAKVYTDLSFFTCDTAFGRDTTKLFNYMTGYARPESLEKLVLSPISMRGTLLDCIDREIANKRGGKPAAVWIKVNSLVDPKIIDKLYEASSAGVDVELIVRGICCLRAGVENLSDNIRVKSVVGRFLEHMRVFCFACGHAMPSRQATVYISSADLMPRNLKRRVESMVAIENNTVHAQILDQIMVANLKDQRQSWYMAPGGDYVRVRADNKSFCAQSYFMNNPSLSGRGSALRRRRDRKT